MSEPLITTPIVSGIAAVHVMLAVFFAAAALLVVALVERWRARRNDLQVGAEKMLRRGFPTADRLGWIDRSDEHLKNLAKNGDDIR